MEAASRTVAGLLQRTRRDAGTSRQGTVGRVPPATALGVCDCNPIEESAAPAPDVQEQPQHHLSSPCRPSRSFMEFTYKGARAAVRGRAFGAGRLVEWRMRRACSPFEAWGTWPQK